MSLADRVVRAVPGAPGLLIDRRTTPRCPRSAHVLWHAARSHRLTAAIAALDGVASITVDPVSGTVTVTASRPVDRADIAAAVEKVGYTFPPSGVEDAGRGAQRPPRGCPDPATPPVRGLRMAAILDPSQADLHRQQEF